MSKPTYEELETAVANLKAALSTATESLANAHHVLRVETARSKELEAQVQGLAAENAIARKAVQTFCDVVQQNTDVICEEVGQDGVKAILAAMSATGSMAATDAALAEIRSEARAEGIWPRIQERDLDALLRFNETCEDGEGYDIGEKAMRRLVELGLCGKGPHSIRNITLFGQWVISAREGEISLEPLQTEEDSYDAFALRMAELRKEQGK